ncbi:hypothetical protein, partial [Ruminococcus sp.]|uniref:hypothetical protein n=1 Tax=Ruminococcus sp. TaxID=41978 RepID=UPI0025E9F436
YKRQLLNLNINITQKAKLQFLRDIFCISRHNLENVQIKNLFFFGIYGIVNYDRQEWLVTDFNYNFVKILSWGHNHGY